MKKPTFCICEIKGADQLRDNRAADQRLCFRYIESALTVLHKSSSVAEEHGLFRTSSETPKTAFLMTVLPTCCDCYKTIKRPFNILMPK